MTYLEKANASSETSSSSSNYDNELINEGQISDYNSDSRATDKMPNVEYKWHLNSTQNIPPTYTTDAHVSGSNVRREKLTVNSKASKFDNDENCYEFMHESPSTRKTISSNNNNADQGNQVLESLKNYTSEFFFLPPVTDCFDYRALKCKVSHKVRGGRGEWKEIALNDMIRVTKGVGKKVKLLVEAPIPFKASDIETNLVKVGRCPIELLNSPQKKSKFSIQNITISSPDITGRTCADMSIKLFELSRRICFQVLIRTEDGTVYKGNTQTFSTHNSGKQPIRYLRKKLSSIEASDDSKVSTQVPSNTPNELKNSVDAAATTTPFDYLDMNDSNVNVPVKRLKCVEEEASRSAQPTMTDIKMTLPNFSNFHLLSTWDKNEMLVTVRRIMLASSRSVIQEGNLRNCRTLAVHMLCQNRQGVLQENLKARVYRDGAICTNVTMENFDGIIGNVLLFNDGNTEQLEDYSGMYTIAVSRRNSETFNDMLTTRMESADLNSGIALVYDLRNSRAEMCILHSHYAEEMHNKANPTLIGSFKIECELPLFSSDIYRHGSLSNSMYNVHSPEMSSFPSIRKLPFSIPFTANRPTEATNPHEVLNVQASLTTPNLKNTMYDVQQNLYLPIKFLPQFQFYPPNTNVPRHQTPIPQHHMIQGFVNGHSQLPHMTQTPGSPMVLPLMQFPTSNNNGSSNTYYQQPQQYQTISHPTQHELYNLAPQSLPLYLNANMPASSHNVQSPMLFLTDQIHSYLPTTGFERSNVPVYQTSPIPQTQLHSPTTLNDGFFIATPKAPLPYHMKLQTKKSPFSITIKSGDISSSPTSDTSNSNSQTP